MMRRLLTTGLAVLCLLQASDARARKHKRTAKVRTPVADTLPENFFSTDSVYSGKATFYRNRGCGACALPPGDTFTAAVSRHQYARASLCGSCVEASGPSGSVIARVIDRCVGCPSGGIDLSREAFARIAPLGMGRAPISWRFAPCPNDTQISLYRKGRTERGQVFLQVRRHGVPLRSLEILADTGWRALPRRADNRFAGRDLPPPPWSLRLTDVWGRSVVDSGIVVGHDSAVALSVRFPGLPHAMDTLLVRGEAKEDASRLQ